MRETCSSSLDFGMHSTDNLAKWVDADSPVNEAQKTLSGNKSCSPKLLYIAILVRSNFMNNIPTKIPHRWDVSVGCGGGRGFKGQSLSYFIITRKWRALQETRTSTLLNKTEFCKTAVSLIFLNPHLQTPLAPSHTPYLPIRNHPRYAHKTHRSAIEIG